VNAARQLDPRLRTDTMGWNEIRKWRTRHDVHDPAMNEQRSEQSMKLHMPYEPKHTFFAFPCVTSCNQYETVISLFTCLFVCPGPRRATEDVRKVNSKLFDFGA
jgi:hypothetical protein